MPHSTSITGQFFNLIKDLESNSLRGGADLVRSNYEGTDALKIYTAILGNFWGEELLNNNLQAVVNGLTTLAGAPTMPANRIALCRQLIKHPNLTQKQLRGLEYLLEVCERHTIAQVVALMDKVKRNPSFCWWVDNVVEKRFDVVGAIASYMLEDMGSSRFNVFAYYLISDIGNINYNCAGLFKSKEYQEWVAKGLSTFVNKPWLNQTHIKIMLRHLPGYKMSNGMGDKFISDFINKMERECEPA